MRTLKTIQICIALIAFGITSLAQVPEGFNYMAIARNGDGDPVAKTDIDVRIAILDADATVAWEEEHSVTTDDYGLFHLVIGDPAALQTGGYEENFADINWAAGNYYVSTSISLVSGVWIPMGSAQLFSVPYALVSKTALGGVGNPFTMYGDTVLFLNPVHVKSSYDITEDEALFAVKRKDGQTMFAVYNQGVRINIPMIDNVKGPKGGFAIGGFGTSKAGYTYDLFTLNKDSVRIYLDKNPDLSKGPKGGFAIGGFDIAGKAPLPHQNYLFIAPDSARIYVKETTKGVKGGFAIGGFGTSKATPTNFMDITPENYFIGHQSGSKVSSGKFNSVLGYMAGKSLTTGSYNTILGNLAGTSVNTGNNNIIVGDNAGTSMSNAYSNTIIGYRAGFSLTDQSYNVFVGHESGIHVNSPGWNGGFNAFFGVASGWAIRTSRDNTFLGINAGMFLDNGTGNVFIGTDAGRAGPDVDPWVPRAYTSSNNTFIGTSAGYNNSQGNENVAIGYSSGSSLQTGSGNVFLGYTAGSEETGSNKLYITNRTLDGDDNPITPLLYGDFSTHQLGINLTSLTATLNVGGSAYISGNLSAGSITAPVTGTLTGNVTGDLTGNVKGDVEGDLTGRVNGVEAGKLYLNKTGEIQKCGGDTFILFWDKGDGLIILDNTNHDFPCHYWFKKINKTDPQEGSGIFDPGSGEAIINETNIDGIGFEVHFGYADGITGYCSVWLQYFNGALIGHYIKY